MTEKNLQSSIMREIGSKPGVRLFRNQMGKYQLADGRWLSSGLAPGSADLIGWQTVEITPDMVGKKLACFASLEIKRPGGRVSPEQLNWRKRVEEAGGKAAIIHSVEEARKFLLPETKSAQ